jgi:hypothetical protein
MTERDGTKQRERLPYPPPWQDTATLALHISASAGTIENWVTQGILPPPRKRGGKLMWKSSEVDAWLTDGNPLGVVDEAARIREAVRRASDERRQPYVSIFDEPHPKRDKP